MGVLSWLIVGAIAGWLAGSLVPGDERFGPIGHVVLGIVGAIVGGVLAGVVIGGDYINGLDLVTLVVATVGAVIVVLAWRLFLGPGARGSVR
jgi:uncharacterized membrane protein YeaQ/YmgE (transglycosylase-associated protein family)